MEDAKKIATGQFLHAGRVKCPQTGNIFKGPKLVPQLAAVTQFWQLLNICAQIYCEFFTLKYTTTSGQLY